MWKRNSIVDKDIIEPSSFSSLNQSRLVLRLRSTQTSDDKLRGSELKEIEKGGSFFDVEQNMLFDSVEDDGGLLKRIINDLSDHLVINIPLKSRFVFIRTMVSGDTEQLRSEIGCCIIEEYLASPPSLIFATKQFIASIALPLLERGAEVRGDRMDILLSTSKPLTENSLNLIDVESSRQFREVQKLCEVSKLQTTQTVLLVSCMKMGMSAAGANPNKKKKKKKNHVKKEVKLQNLDWTGDSMGSFADGPTADTTVFKPSKQKKVHALAFIATNCQIHMSTLDLTNEQDFKTKVIVSISFGAPAAHALGFKNGGLRSIKSKIAAFNFAKASDTMKHDIIQLEFEAKVRESMVVGQALGAALASSLELLTRAISGKRAALLRQFTRIGMLLHSVSLLTTTGHEEAMLDDFAGAYDLLKVKLSLEPPPHVSDRLSSSQAEKHDSSSPVCLTVISVASDGPNQHFGNLLIQVQVEPASAYHWVRKALKLPGNTTMPQIQIRPILFNLGVNEMQSVANVTGATSIQSEINDQGVLQLTQYHKDFTEFLASGEGENKALGDLPELLLELSEVIELEKRDRGKAVNLLLISCYIARQLNGARTTSCKSAKDRTSVFHTLEVVRIANRDQLIDGSVEQMALDELRGVKGVRLRNCQDNVGRPKYAFNKLQLQALPAELRPPTATANPWGPS